VNFTVTKKLLGSGVLCQLKSFTCACLLLCPPFSVKIHVNLPSG